MHDNFYIFSIYLSSPNIGEGSHDMGHLLGYIAINRLSVYLIRLKISLK